MLTAKHSKEALAFLTLFKVLKPEIKQEVRNMLIVENTANDELTPEMLTAASMNSIGEIWDTEEDKHWDNFIKAKF